MAQANTIAASIVIITVIDEVKYVKNGLCDQQNNMA